MWKTGLPVRSAVLKPRAGQLVPRWVTTWESWLLIVFGFPGENFSFLVRVFRMILTLQLL